MTGHEYDLFVIGAGSGGVRASRVAAQLGARVAIAERGPLGGTCVNVGCVPKKLLMYGSHVAEEIEEARGFGWQLDSVRFEWSRLIARKNVEIDRLNRVYRQLLEDAGVRLVHGTARLRHRHRVEVDDEAYSTDSVLIATGGRPVVPDFPGVELAITSNEVFFLRELPRRLILIGGGYIAVEFASIFRALGSTVTIVHRGDQILRGFDDDVRAHLAQELSKKSIDILCGLEVERLFKRGDELALTLGDGSELTADCVVCATGRAPNSDGLGLREVGVALDEDGAVRVDQTGRTTVDNIYAVGDCTNRVNLTPVAIAEGQAVARRLFAGSLDTLSYENIPSAVFSQPAVGAVGLTEEEARERHRGVDIYRSTFTPMKQTLGGRDEKTMMKLVVDAETQRVLGIHMVGPDAGEIIQGFAVALNCGATKSQLDATIGIHPTAAEELVTMGFPVRSLPGF